MFLCEVIKFSRAISFKNFLCVFQESSNLEGPVLCGQEHVMARLLAFKHLPPSLELPENSSTTGSQRPTTTGNSRGTSSSQSGETHI